MTNISMDSKLEELHQRLGNNKAHTKIANATGISRRHVQRFLRNETDMTFRKVVAIAECTKVGLDGIKIYRRAYSYCKAVFDIDNDNE